MCISKGSHTYLQRSLFVLNGTGLCNHLGYNICTVQKMHKIVLEGTDEKIKGTKHEGTTMYPCNKYYFVPSKGTATETCLV